MDSTSSIFDQFMKFNNNNAYIDFIIILFFLISGFLVKKYLPNWKVKQVYKTIFVGSALSMIYVLIMGDFSKAMLVKYLISYTVATSLYEVILAFIIGILKNRGVKIEDPNANTNGDQKAP